MIGGLDPSHCRTLFTTICGRRCRGMTLAKMPLWCGSTMIMCGMVSAPSVAHGSPKSCLLDRFAGLPFPRHAGWEVQQHWGCTVSGLADPEVYVMIIPASPSPRKSSRCFHARPFRLPHGSATLASPCQLAFGAPHVPLLE